MSRIHEALKQAEKDRLAESKSGVAAQVIVPQTASDINAVLLDSTPEIAVADETRLKSPAIETRFENREANSLLAGCRKPEWSPNPESMLFFKTEGAHGSEEFRTLRSHLYAIREKQPLKKVLISSALPEEGKTFVAANLAQVIVCQHGRSALLIDADLRKPTLHRVLGAPATPGLSDYLNGVADEKEIIQRAPLEGLFLIPSGTPAKNPAELIASPSMSVLLDSMAEHFDWIVIDCPPCVPVADARVIAAHCDGVLLVVRAEATPAELTVKAKRQFKEQSLLGVVLNRAAGTGRYGSYYYGAYGVSQDSATASSVKL